MQNNNKILVLSGPTGSGESTITRKLISKYPVFQRLVTATTRPMRSGEQDKIDYYYFSKEEFQKMIAGGLILEYSYIENRDTYYGTYKPDFEKKMQAGYVIANTDYVGTLYYKENFKAVTIFIKPKSIDVLNARLKGRNPEMTEIELLKRLENAKKEIEKEEQYYDTTVINKDGELEEAIIEVEKILKKEGFVF
ncbi:MAG: guanylate kinase [Candidatus Moranbacteria bacterium]|nr:guanylate kinase [Candidatus Moranbacteria bacterium]